MSEIVNKVQQSRLVTVDLEKLSVPGDITGLDISQFLFRGLLLKEKEFRELIDEFDWSQYSSSYVAVYCSTDAIIPSWAWMLITTRLSGVAREVIFGTEEEAAERQLFESIESWDWEKYRNKYVLLKGCSKAKVPPGAYLEATKRLLPVVDKLMYGEACSNIPVYRKK